LPARSPRPIALEWRWAGRSGQAYPSRYRRRKRSPPGQEGSKRRGGDPGCACGHCARGDRSWAKSFPGLGSGPTIYGPAPGDKGFLINCETLCSWSAANFRVGTLDEPPERSILPPSDRRCRLGRRLRSSFFWRALPRCRAAGVSPGKRPMRGLCKNHPMELTWYGRTCVRMRSKDAVVVADAYQSVVGPTGRGISGDIVTYSHPDDSPHPKARADYRGTARRCCPAASKKLSVWTGPASTRSGKS